MSESTDRPLPEPTEGWWLHPRDWSDGTEQPHFHARHAHEGGDRWHTHAQTPTPEAEQPAQEGVQQASPRVGTWYNDGDWLVAPDGQRWWHDAAWNHLNRLQDANAELRARAEALEETLRVVANGYHLVCQQYSESGAHFAPSFMECRFGRCIEATNALTTPAASQESKKDRLQRLKAGLASEEAAMHDIIDRRLAASQEEGA